MQLSRGARRLLETLIEFQKTHRTVNPSQKWLAGDRTERTVTRWCTELKRAGLLRVVKQGQSPAEYTVTPAGMAYREPEVPWA